MSKNQLQYKMDNIIRAVQGATWLCHHTKLEEIRAFLEFKAGSGQLDSTSLEAFTQSEGSELFRSDSGQRIDVDGIRYVPIMGVMAPKMNLMTQLSGGVSTQLVMKEVRLALSDSEVKTVLLHVDSPGGVSTFIPELSTLIHDGRQQKRIVTFAEGMMASGSLWVGTAAAEVYASASTEVGSQGAYQILLSKTASNVAKGLDYRVIRAGEYKALGNEFEAISPRTLAETQRLIDDLDQMFVAALATNRSVSEQFVRDRFGRGKMFTAKDAVDRKMIDGVVVFEDLLDRERAKNSSATSISVTGGNFMTVTPKVKAAMFAQGCIDSLDATDEVCVAYLRGVSKARGGGADYEVAGEQELISLLMTPAEETTTGIDHQGEEYATTVIDPDRYVPRDQAQAEVRARNAQIQLAAKELSVPDKMVTEALISEKQLDAIRADFLKYAEEHSPPAASIHPGAASIDKVAQGMVGAILDRCGLVNLATPDEKTYARSFYDSTMMDMVRGVLNVNGIRPSGDRRKDALRFLSLGMEGSGLQNSRTLHYGESERMVMEASYNRVGDHPDALSNLMGRMMDVAYDQAEHTYTVFTKRAPDVPDQRPKTFFETAVFQELDAMGEDEKHDQLKFTSAMKAMLQVAKYGNKVALTEEMIINDDLSIFDTQLATLQEAAVNTVDNSCRTLLVSNPLMIDGTAMFTAGRGNYVASGSGGAPPNATSLALHRTMHRMIKGFGSTRTMNRAPSESLHPAAQEEAVRQTLLFNASDPKVAQEDAKINTVRGTITPHMDSMLDGYTNGTKKWWTFVPKYKPIIIAFLQGAGGPAGRRTTWIDPDTGSRYVALDLWAGYAPLNFRGTVLNEGQ